MDISVFDLNENLLIYSDTFTAIRTTQNKLQHRYSHFKKKKIEAALIFSLFITITWIKDKFLSYICQFKDEVHRISFAIRSHVHQHFLINYFSS